MPCRAKVAQWVLRQLDKNWQSFFAALAAWQADPSKFLGRPSCRATRTSRQGRNLLIYTIQALSVPALRDGRDCPIHAGHQRADQSSNHRPAGAHRAAQWLLHRRSRLRARAGPSSRQPRAACGRRHWSEQSGNASFRQAGLCPAHRQRAASQVDQPVLQQATAELQSQLGSAGTSRRLERHDDQSHAAD